MTTSSKKYSSMISIILFLAILFLTVFLPSTGIILSITLLLFSFIVACFTIVKRNRNVYIDGKITRGVFLRNVSFEIFGILLAMVLASFLARYVAQAATMQINHDFTRFMAGILVGILIGSIVGLSVKRIWGRFVKP